MWGNLAPKIFSGHVEQSPATHGHFLGQRLPKKRVKIEKINVFFWEGQLFLDRSFIILQPPRKFFWKVLWSILAPKKILGHLGHSPATLGYFLDQRLPKKSRKIAQLLSALKVFLDVAQVRLSYKKHLFYLKNLFLLIKKN